ncbi:hypothetical protein NEF87_004264 [Candidatus Lokiarchaeum ossiferum]|uniref:Polysaccharide biosynthesis protein n=1 Tax=Candidatus Lokiarchaeum ossiferum TaxID=2951803 RepID=A0ABY6HWS5_9ARCH|nr:hypothetical protein NEF87_004264 [Candidatus Lokiarchaeum sp. B-35]
MKDKFIIRMIFQVGLQFLNIFAAYFFAKYLSLELMGVTGEVSSYIGIFTMFLSIGIESIYIQHSGDSNFESYYSNFMFIKLSIIFLSFISLLFFIFLIDFQYKGYFLLISLTELITKYSIVVNTHLRAKLKIYKAEIPSFVIGFLNAIVKTIISINLNKFSNPLIVYGAVSLLFAGINLFFTLYISKGERTRTKISKSRIFQLLKETKPLIFTSLILIFNDNIGNLIIDHFYGTEQFAYYFFVKSFIIVTLTTVTLSIGVIYESYFAKWFVNNKYKEIQKMTQKIEKYSAIFYCAVAILTLLNAEIAFQIFLPNYIDSIPILQILVFIPLFSSLSRPYNKHLYAGKKQGVISRYLSIRSVCFLILIVIIIPENIWGINLLGFGVIGYCFLNLTFNIIDYAFYRYFSKKYFGIEGENKLFFILPLSFLTFLISYLLKYLLIEVIESQLILLVLSSLISFIFFIISLIICHFINRDDISFFLDLFNLKNYKKGLKDEFSMK